MDRQKIEHISENGKVVSLRPLHAAKAAWTVLIDLSTNHPDPSVRIEASDRIIRLAHELGPEIPVDLVRLMTRKKDDS